MRRSSGGTSNRMSYLSATSANITADVRRFGGGTTPASRCDEWMLISGIMNFSGSACVAGMRGNAEGGFDITHSSRHHASCEQGRSDGSFAFSTVPKTGGLFDSSNVNFDSVRRNIAASLDVLCVW